jgi:hypothetical protein
MQVIPNSDLLEGTFRELNCGVQKVNMTTTKG